MKRFLLGLLLIISVQSFGQVLQKPSVYGYQFRRLVVDTLFALPADTFSVPAALQSYPFLAKKGSSLYLWNTSTLVWASVGGAGSTPTLQQVLATESNNAVITASTDISPSGSYDLFFGNNGLWRDITHLASLEYRVEAGTVSLDGGNDNLIYMTVDTIRIDPSKGNLKIDSLNYTLSTTGKKIMLRDTVTGLVENIDPALIGGGITTLAAIGSSPNANGATISGSTLNLEPASASFGGVVTTGTQTLAGNKTLSGITTLGNYMVLPNATIAGGANIQSSSATGYFGLSEVNAMCQMYWNNNSITVSTGQIMFNVAGVDRFTGKSTEVVINDNSQNYDFRVEGDTDPNLIFADASTDRVGIGTGTPIYKLHVDGTGFFNNTLTVNGSILPLTDNANSLGTSSFRWAEVNTGQVNNTASISFGTGFGTAFEMGSDGVFRMKELTTGISSPVAGYGELYARNDGKLTYYNDEDVEFKLQDLETKSVTTQYDNTTTTLGNITGLSNTLIAGKRYSFEAILYTTSNVAGGVKFSIGGTATATNIIYEAVVIDANTNAAQTRALAMATTVGAVTAVTNAYVKITGTITVNTGGTITVQAAANAAVGTTSVLVGSTFLIKQI